MRVAAAQGVAPSLKGCIYSRYLLDSFQEFFGFAPQTRTKTNPAPANTILDQRPLPGQRFVEARQLILLLSLGPAPAGVLDGAGKPAKRQDGNNNGAVVVSNLLAAFLNKIQQDAHKNQPQAPPNDNNGAANTPVQQAPPDDNAGNVPPPLTPPEEPKAASPQAQPVEVVTPQPAATPQPAGTPSVVQTPAAPPAVSTNPVSPAKAVTSAPPVAHAISGGSAAISNNTEPANPWLYPAILVGALAVLAAAVGAAIWLRKPPAPPVHAASAAPAPIARCAFESGPGMLVADGPLVSGPKLRIAVTLEPGATMLSEAT